MSGAQGTPESETGSFECFQNYTAPEVFIQGLAGIVDQQDVESMIRAQKQMLQRFEKTNEMLANCNQLSITRLKDATNDFKKHTALLVDMKKDLDYIFKKIKTIKTKLNQQYPDAYNEAVKNSLGEDPGEENEEGECSNVLETSTDIEAENKTDQAKDKVASLEEGVKRKRRNFSDGKPKSETRVLNPDSWVATMRKKHKNAGKEYINMKDKLIPAKKLGEGCDDSCRLKCKSNISLEQRKKIFDKFYKTPDTLSKWHFISQCMEVYPKKSCKDPDKKSKREYSKKYFFNIEGIKCYVCKTTFMSTLQISNGPITTVTKKKAQGTFFSPDQRGKQKNRGNKISNETINSVIAHVNSFERVPSNCMKENSKKEYITEPNLNIKKMHELYQQWVKNQEPLNFKPATHRQYHDIFNRKFSIGFLKTKTKQEVIPK